MKPPSRRRTAPERYATLELAKLHVGPLRLTWTYKEKLQLLRGLRAQRDRKNPQPPVDGRDPREVSTYMAWLRGRAAREALQTEYERWVKQKRDKRCRTPAPIELWTNLTHRMSEPIEEAVSAAFSQMLTIAATEPLSLQHSVPPKKPPGSTTARVAQKPPTIPEKKSQETGSSGEEPGSSAEEMASRSEPTASKAENVVEWKEVDFEKIYKYLSKAAKGDNLPKLSPEESAVVLSLLHSLPAHLQTLDCNSLASYVYQKYSAFNAQPNPGETAAQEVTGTDPPALDWKDVGFCPLNPFLIPLDLLNLKERD
ncbi:snRNA-activating protein complex subunit 2 [Spea bombifrons]|uniref:snRNA-activating protein complex subunit 2 n=1 Tax=Spea bombifrons TaxID=233779 RepID=UPI00234B1E86|nr:snRNA-activating protein complex subunit 2 [Spea bombifrons]XP_053320851.1 snRNA-activating protein complex subunit 2 [Spea bombifrons]